MTGAPDRLLNVAIAEDEAANAALGGRPRETLSGSIGRACGFGGGHARAWGPLARALVDGLFGRGHCQRQAEKEARRRALEAGGAA